MRGQRKRRRQQSPEVRCFRKFCNVEKDGWASPNEREREMRGTPLTSLASDASMSGTSKQHHAICCLLELEMPQ